MFCSTSYWSNTEIQSLNKLNAGGPSLAPCPTAYIVQGRLHGVAVPIGTLFNLPNRLLSTYIGYSKESFPALIREGIDLSPVCSHHYHAELRLFCSGLTEWNGVPFALRLLPRTLSNTFYS